MTFVQPELGSLFIFNSSFAVDEEKNEEEKILYFYPPNVNLESKLKYVGLSEALINFSNKFNQRNGCDSVYLEKQRFSFYQPENGFWMVLIVKNGYFIINEEEITKKNRNNKDVENMSNNLKNRGKEQYKSFELDDNVIQAHLKNCYKIFRLLNGTFEQILHKFSLKVLCLKVANFLNDHVQKIDFKQNILENTLLPLIYGTKPHFFSSNVFLEVQFLLNTIQLEFKDIKHYIFFDNQRLVFSSMKNQDTITISSFIKIQLQEFMKSNNKKKHKFKNNNNENNKSNNKNNSNINNNLPNTNNKKKNNNNGNSKIKNNNGNSKKKNNNDILKRSKISTNSKYFEDETKLNYANMKKQNIVLSPKQTRKNLKSNTKNKNKQKNKSNSANENYFKTEIQQEMERERERQKKQKDHHYGYLIGPENLNTMPTPVNSIKIYLGKKNKEYYLVLFKYKQYYLTFIIPPILRHDLTFYSNLQKKLIKLLQSFNRNLIDSTLLNSHFTNDENFILYDSSSNSGADFSIKSIEIENTEIKIHIWDTAGSERYRAVTRSYFHGVSCTIFVYDVASRKSFNDLQVWLEDCRKSTDPNSVGILIANKIDLAERKIEREEGEVFAEENDLLYLETSAKTGENVEDIFMLGAKTVYQRVQEGKLEISQPMIDSDDEDSDFYQEKTNEKNNNNNNNNSSNCC
ncbi:vacuolar fusion protein ccz1 homolog-related [Anaeramoeba flamelloides]|uniref:Vacuolar fusion protein ccz1 homolog-related n=1 Tax=Anaeramoeba flamelloides TaxID=1746091 RepID=A0ABQ8Y1K4_9EUKA|nr:vacuolar fusion protein ccz1 homolog-related [Anaeramoeba flamelloides]